MLEELIYLREATLDLVQGRQSRRVLNAPVDEAIQPSGISTGSELATAIMRAVNGFKADAMDQAGRLVNYAQLRDSAAYRHYRTQLTPQLAYFDPATLSSRAEQLAFWINLYNALVIDAVINFGVRESVARSLSGLTFFRAAAYNVGGYRCSLEDIEQGILRANRGNPFLPGTQFAPGDLRSTWVIEPFERRIHFALNCASQSCPPIGSYTADQIDAQLNMALRNFLAADVVVDTPRNEIQLSAIFDWYRTDFGGTDGIIALLRQELPDDARRAWLRSIRSCRLVYRTYDWRLNNVN